MNLAKANIVLRPREIGEVLDLACVVVASSLDALYLRLSAILLLPCIAGCLALHYVLGWGWLYVWIIALSLGALVQGPFTVAAGRFIFAEDLTVRDVLRAFRQRFWAYFGAIIIARFYIALAALTVFLAPFAGMRMLFVPEASLLEMAGASAATKRASRFVMGRNARAFEIMMSLLLAHVGIVIVAELLGGGIVKDLLQLGQPFGVLWKHGGSAYAIIGFFAAIPYVATARFLFYIDRRTRTDGWDIQLKFMAVGAQERQRTRIAA